MIASLKRVRQFFVDVGEILSISFNASPALFFSLIGIQIILGLRPVVSAWVIKRLVDVLATNLQGDVLAALLENMWFLIILQGIVIASGKFLQDIQAYCRAELSRKLDVVTQTMLFDELNRFDGLRYFETPAFYNRMDSASFGLAYGPPQILFKLTELVQYAVTMVSFISILLVVSPWLAFLVILGGMPQLIGRLLMSRMNFDVYQKKRPKARRRDYLSTLLSRREAAKDVRAYNLTGYLFDEFLATTHDVHNLDSSNQLKQLGIKSVLNLVAGVIAGITFGLVVQQALNRTISVGDVTFYFSALVGIMGALNNIADRISSLNAFTLYFGEYKALQEMPNDVPSVHHPKRVPTLQRGITLKDVTFAYQDNLPPVLDNLSLTIPAGKIVALVGESGTGKTTLAKLLNRLYDPEQGQILWDDIDLREFRTEMYRQHTATIFQDFERYQMSLRENIAVGQTELSDNIETIRQIAEQVGIVALVDNLPNGWETVLSHAVIDDGTGGMDVSGGEWQKIALARLYLRDADFVILDEPTSDLDAEAERQLYEQFVAQKGDKTALLISGRFSTIRMADAIAVLKDGRIAEYGTHEELLALNGEYARLYRTQAEQYR